jgi:hypothetical protein
VERPLPFARVPRSAARGWVGTTFDQDGKFVTPEAREKGVSRACSQWTGEHVSLAKAGLKTQADLDKHLIANCGAERVVESLKAIEVGQQDRILKTGIPSSLCVTTLQTVKKETPVG